MQTDFLMDKLIIEHRDRFAVFRTGFAVQVPVAVHGSSCPGSGHNRFVSVC